MIEPPKFLDQDSTNISAWIIFSEYRICHILYGRFQENGTHFSSTKWINYKVFKRSTDSPSNKNRYCLHQFKSWVLLIILIVIMMIIIEYTSILNETTGNRVKTKTTAEIAISICRQTRKRVKLPEVFFCDLQSKKRAERKEETK